MTDTILDEVVILFLLSIVVNVICSRVKLPATVGFLLTGILCGPSLLGIVDDASAVGVLAELGVALLLFTIGMELSGEALARLKKPVFLGGSLQIGLTIASIALICPRDISLQTGIFIGCLVALSSSAIVLRMLQEKGSTNTPHGRLSLAILVFQDIMVAPMLLAVPLLAGKMGFTPESVFVAVARTVGILGGVLLFARYGLNRLMAAVVRTRARELLLLTTLGLCMGLSLLTASLGLSLSLGAFLAGLILARSEYSMSVVSGVLPYRDVFMSLFFISVGMLLDFNYLIEHLWMVTLGAAVFIVVKALLTLPSVLIQGYPLRTAIIVALSLAQVGEFAFVLGAQGMAVELITPGQYQQFLAVSILTMVLTPGMMFIAPKVATQAARLLPAGRRRVEENEDQQENDKKLQNHLIIVGFGISGKHLAQAAKQAGIQYEILEMNPDTVSRCRHVEPIMHGDASQPLVLEHVGIRTARVLAIVISDPVAVRSITAEARAMSESVHIVARTRFLGEVDPLQRLGANDVIAEELESSMEVFSRVLQNYLVPQQEIDVFSARIRQENYAMVRSMGFGGEVLGRLIKQMPNVSVQAVRLEGGSPLVGTSLQESALRESFNLTVVAISRNGETCPSPSPNFVFEEDDVVYIFGDTRCIHATSVQLSRGLAPTEEG
ncbi:MAG: cation:proton antiporter [Desulfovibrionaceae bacterium]